MDLNPSEIARKNFTLVRRGFDPQEVSTYLEAIAAHVSSQAAVVHASTREVEGLEQKLEEARSTEEAVRLTMLAATKTKDEMVAQAEARAAEIIREAEEDANRVRSAAHDEADRTLTGARSEALELLNSSHSDAKALVSAARAENNELVGRIEELRRTSERVTGLLRKIADEGLGTVAAATAELEQLGTTEILPELASPALDDHSPAPKGTIDLIRAEDGHAGSEPMDDADNDDAEVAMSAAAVARRPIPAVLPDSGEAVGMLGRAEPRRDRTKPTIFDPVDEPQPPADREQILAELRNLGSS